MSIEMIDPSAPEASPGQVIAVSLPKLIRDRLYLGGQP